MSLPGRQEGNQRPPMAFFACHRFGPLPKGVKDGSPLPAPAFAPLPLPGAAGSARLWPRAPPKTAHPRLHRRHRRILSASPAAAAKRESPPLAGGRRACASPAPCPVGDSASSQPSPGLIPVPRLRFLSAPPPPRGGAAPAARPQAGRQKKAAAFAAAPYRFGPPSARGAVIFPLRPCRRD